LQQFQAARKSKVTSLRLTFFSLRLRIIQLMNTGVNYSNGFARKPSVEKGDKRKMEPLLCSGHDNFTHNCRAGKRPVLIMISLRKAFTVLKLMFIRLAISLLLKPCNTYSNTSRSRCVTGGPSFE
jgi:hypothetical protein